MRIVENFNVDLWESLGFIFKISKNYDDSDTWKTWKRFDDFIFSQSIHVLVLLWEQFRGSIAAMKNIISSQNLKHLNGSVENLKLLKKLSFNAAKKIRVKTR